MNMSLDAVKSMVARCQTEFVYVKDQQSRYVDANDNFLSFFGFSGIAQIYQKTDYDFPWPAYAPQYICNDQEAMAMGEIQVIELAFHYHGEPQFALTHKYPFYNEDTKISGVIGISAIIRSSAIKKIIPLLERGDFNKIKISDSLFNSQVNKNANVPLTEREMDVLYCMLHGLSQKQIANHLNLSVRTVEDYVDRIKAKLNFNNKSQLFDMAIESGLMNIAPKHLWNKIH